MRPEGSPAAQPVISPDSSHSDATVRVGRANTGRFWRHFPVWNVLGKEWFWGSSDVFGPSRHLLSNVAYTSRKTPPPAGTESGVWLKEL